MTTENPEVGEDLDATGNPDVDIPENPRMEAFEEMDDVCMLALELLAGSSHPLDAALGPSSLEELHVWTERVTEELLRDLDRMKQGVPQISICSAIPFGGAAEFDAPGFARTWAKGDMLSFPAQRRKKPVSTERMIYHGRDAYKIHLRDVFHPNVLRRGVPWASDVAYVANHCDPDGRATSRYFAAVDLLPSRASDTGSLNVVLKGPDGHSAYVALTADRSIGELKGDLLPVGWENVRIGMFLDPPAAHESGRRAGGRGSEHGKHTGRPMRNRILHKAGR